MLKRILHKRTLSHSTVLCDNLLIATLYTHPLTSLSHPKLGQCRCPAHIQVFQAVLSENGVMKGIALASWRSVVESHDEDDIALVAIKVNAEF